MKSIVHEFILTLNTLNMVALVGFITFNHLVILEIKTLFGLRSKCVSVWVLGGGSMLDKLPVHPFIIRDRQTVLSCQSAQHEGMWEKTTFSEQHFLVWSFSLCLSWQMPPECGWLLCNDDKIVLNVILNRSIIMGIKPATLVQWSDFWLCHPWTLAWWKLFTHLMRVWGHICKYAHMLLRPRVYFSKRQMHQAQYPRRCQTITWDLSANWVSKWVILSSRHLISLSALPPPPTICLIPVGTLSLLPPFLPSSCFSELATLLKWEKNSSCFFLLPFLSSSSRSRTCRLLLLQRRRWFETCHGEPRLGFVFSICSSRRRPLQWYIV